MKNTLEGMKSKLNDIAEWISELEDRIVEITDSEQKKEKRMKSNEESWKEHWDNSMDTNICIIGFSEGEDREKGVRIYLKT